MRILILHSRYLSGAVSGENRVVEDESELLGRAGHDVRVWAPSIEQREGFGLLRVGVETVWSRPVASQVRGLIQAFKPEVVHVHNLFPALSPAALRAATGENIPVVVTLHNYRMLCLPATLFRDGAPCTDCLGRFPWPGIVHRCYQQSLGASASIATSHGLHRTMGTYDGVNLFLAVSSFVRDMHLQAGWPQTRVTVKPNFAWPSRQREGAGTYFLYVGRLTPEKGLATVMSAWNDLSHELRVIGDGPELESLKTVAPPPVKFLGALNSSRIPELLAGARAVLVPSVWFEPAPRTIVEAYAAGVPVLASRIGRLPELVDEDRSGLLLPPDSPRAWAAGVEVLMDDENSIKFGKRARDLWEKEYSPELAVRRLERAYQRVVM